MASAGATDEAEVVVPARGRASHSAPVAGGERVAWLVSVHGDGLDVLLSASFTRADGSGAETCLAAPARTSGGEGSFCAPCAGTLVVTLDNAHSVLTRKNVRVSVARGEDNSDVLARDPTLANRKVMAGMALFFTNRFDEAEAFFDVHRGKVPIYNLCWATVSFFRALMTFEPDVIAAAQARIRGSQALSETWLPREGMLASLRGLVGGGGGGGGGGGVVGGAARPHHQPPLSERQLEGTLVHSEATMLTSLLCLMEESLLALVKTGLAIRSGWRHYQAGDRALGGCVSAHVTHAPQLHVLLADLPRAAALFPHASGAKAVDCLLPPPPPPPALDAAAVVPPPVVVAAHGHVVGGFEFGLGAFNCLASILPPIVLRVIAVLGFPCDRRAGLAQLRASVLRGGVTAPLGALFLLCMRVLLPSFHSGDVTEHVAEAEAVLALMLPRYPDSALFLWLGGRLARMQGDVARAHALLSRAQHLPTAWPQLVHLCMYELGWNDAFRLHWLHASERFALLARENAWSKMFYTYMTALAALQRGDLAGGRRAMVGVLRLWAAAASRKLGNRVISADQYALRRAAEYVAATAIVDDDGGGGPPDSEDDVEAILRASGGYSGPRVLLPRAVARGSTAHAAALAMPLPLPGLECVYLFNGPPQMDAPALVAAVAQVDAVVGAIARGRVFDATLPLWRGCVGAACCTAVVGGGEGAAVGGATAARDEGGDAASDDAVAGGAWGDSDPEEGAWGDSSGGGRDGDGAAPSTAPAAPLPRGPAGHELSPAAVAALLDAAAGVVAVAWDGSAAAAATSPATSPVRGRHGDGDEGGKGGDTAASPCAATPSMTRGDDGASEGSSSSSSSSSSSRGSGSGSGSSSGGGSGSSSARASSSFGFGGVLSGWRSTVGSVAGGALAAVGLGGGGGGGGGTGGGSGGGASAAAPALPPYARPTPSAPRHTVAVAALVRGALCAALGHVDAAVACFEWVVQHASPSAGVGGAPARRELHAFAYAHYELGVLFADGAKVKAAAAAAADGAPAAVPPPATAAGRHSRKLEGLASCALLAPLSVAQCVGAAKRHLAAARDVRPDFNWRLRLHLRVHLSQDDLRGTAAAATAATAAGLRGGGGGGGGARSVWGAASWGEHAAAYEGGVEDAGVEAAAATGEEEEEAGADKGGEDSSEELSELAAAVGAAEEERGRR